MINSLIRYGMMFILLLLLQVVLFDNIQFSGYVNPYVYILFIMLLPVEIPSWFLLLVSFFMGIMMDLFSGTPGMHSSATVFAAFARPGVLRLISPRDGYESHSEPGMLSYGMRWFLLYSIFMVLIHHTVLFYLEVFRFTDFFRTFLRVLLSSMFTITFIMILEFYRKGR